MIETNYLLFWCPVKGIVTWENHDKPKPKPRRIKKSRRKPTGKPKGRTFFQ